MSGAVIAEVIPEVSLIIGKQPPIEALPPADATHRFQQLFLNFIRVFPDRQHPLVLFLDDLQWADLASLRFLRVLLNGSRSWNLLLIGTYRDNEITEGHPLQELLDEDIHKADSALRRMKIEALNLSEVQLFVAETLHSDPEKTSPLAKVLFQKTVGNPFYLTQLLRSVYNDRLIYFNEKKGRWEWKLQSIKDREGFNDVIQLIVERFDKLPEQTRFVLSMAGCIGNTFGLSLLSLVCGQSLQQTEQDLSFAVYEGLVLTSNETDLNNQQTNYTFLHDRVQQAIHDLLPKTEIKEIHLKIGRIMLRHGLLEGSDDFLLETASQLNWGNELIADPMEKRQLAEINLRAGRKAKATTAYDTALVLLQAGVKLLQDEGMSMAEFGLKIPLKATLVSVMGELVRTWLQLRGRMDRWIELPETQDPHHKALASIVIAAASQITIVSPQLSVILFSKYVRQALKKGDSEVFSFALSSYALILCLGFGKYKTGLRLAEKALQYPQKLDSVFVKGRVWHIIGMILLFNRPKDSSAYFKQGIQYNLESGDNFCSLWSHIACC